MVPRKITAAERSYLEACIRSGKTYVSMAKDIGVCVDTLKRILNREGLANFNGAKFVAAQEVKTWTRPCMRCKSTAPRPKFIYYCDSCRPVDDGVEVYF